MDKTLCDRFLALAEEAGLDPSRSSMSEDYWFLNIPWGGSVQLEEEGLRLYMELNKRWDIDQILSPEEIVAFCLESEEVHERCEGAMVRAAGKVGIRLRRDFKSKEGVWDPQGCCSVGRFGFSSLHFGDLFSGSLKPYLDVHPQWDQSQWKVMTDWGISTLVSLDGKVVKESEDSIRENSVSADDPEGIETMALVFMAEVRSSLEEQIQYLHRSLIPVDT